MDKKIKLVLRNIAGCIVGWIAYILSFLIFSLILIFLLKIPILNWFLTYPSRLFSLAAIIMIFMPIFLAYYVSVMISERNTSGRDIGTGILTIFILVANISVFISAVQADDNSFWDIVSFIISFGGAVIFCAELAAKAFSSNYDKLDIK